MNDRQKEIETLLAAADRALDRDGAFSVEDRERHAQRCERRALIAAVLSVAEELESFRLNGLPVERVSS